MATKKAGPKKAAAKKRAAKVGAPPAPVARAKTSQGKPYTGNSDGAAERVRPGMKVFINHMIYLSDGAYWNNGDFVNRTMRGKTSLSVHATGRAADLSFRFMGHKGVKPAAKGRAVAEHMMDFAVRHADVLGLEMAIDYTPAPHGRAWRCDRWSWRDYSTATVSGAPGGDWTHYEIAPAMANNAEAMKQAFKDIFSA